jgi:hypothetical protein
VVRRLSQRLYPWCAALFGAACLWFFITALRYDPPIGRSYLATMAAGCLLFSASALATSLKWRIGPPLALVSGLVLTLYATSVVLLGWEDVGGAAGAIPVALVTGLTGIMGILASRPAREAT